MVKKKANPLREAFEIAAKNGGSIVIEFNGDGSVHDYKLKKVASETIPEAGHFKFYVDCKRLDIYTCIGADNQHHASNKATKLFGPHWTCVTQRMGMTSTQFRTVKEFTELIKTLPI